MYIGADWEFVKSIKGIYIAYILPNTGVTSFFLMYIYVLRWTAIHRQNNPDEFTSPLLLACRRPLPGLHPLKNGRLAVANIATHFDVRRPITPHPSLGKP